MKKISKTGILTVLMFLFIIGSAVNVFATDLNKIGNPKEGFYYIYCGFGTGGDKLYYDKTANWKTIKWGKTGSVWYIRKDKNTGAYKIELADDPSYFIHTGTNNVTGYQSVTVEQTKKIGWYLWYFHDYGDNNYVLELGENGEKATHSKYEHGDPMYVMHRHDRMVSNDYLEVMPNLYYSVTHDKADKILYNSWKFHFEPTTYNRAIANIEAKIMWLRVNKNDRLVFIKNAIQNGKLWNKVSKIEIQCSTDKTFEKDVITKTVSKNSGKISLLALNNLPLDTTYYVRARYISVDGVTSKWSIVRSFYT